MSINQALQFGFNKLKQAKINSARLDAEVLLCELLTSPYPLLEKEGSSPPLFKGRIKEGLIRIDKSFLYFHPEFELNKNQVAKYKKYISRRVKHEPVAYIIGHKEFYGLDFIINKNVLIPRPESELLVELALKQLTTNNQQLTKVIDIGTGSGCIVISIIKNLPITNYPSNSAGRQLPITAYAIDKSSQALSVARKNAKLHKVDKKIKFVKSDLLLNVKNIKPDIIVANLPYLTSEQYKNNPDLKHEPKDALVAGHDGLKYYEKLLNQTKSLLTHYFLPLTCLFEIDPSQKMAMQKMIKKMFPKAKIEFIKDLKGKNRVVVIRL